MSKFIGDHLNMVRETVKLIIGLLIGHCKLSKHMSNPDLTENATARRQLEAHFIPMQGSGQAR